MVTDLTLFWVNKCYRRKIPLLENSNVADLYLAPIYGKLRKLVESAGDCEGDKCITGSSFSSVMYNASIMARINIPSYIASTSILTMEILLKPF